MLYIQNDVYYTVREAAKLAKVPERTLRRWLSSGELTHFLYPFQQENGPVLLRLRPPTEEEVLLMEEKQIYRMPEGGTTYPLPEALDLTETPDSEGEVDQSHRATTHRLAGGVL